jgi:alpha-beta hydrolase superfamily lysophospholipase
VSIRQPDPERRFNKVGCPMKSTDMMIDVTAAVAIGEPVHIAATLHLPDGIPDEPVDLILAVHGGGYTRAYWHPPFADESYSFARFFTARGKALLTIDMLGMGASSRPEPESRLDRGKIAAAQAAALAQVKAQIGRALSVTLLGHSMGGLMAITQAASYADCDRLAVLGWANEPMVLGDTDVATLQADLIPSGYLATPRERMRKLFYWPDVPMELIEGDEANGSTTPACLGRDALTQGIVHDASSQIAVPVLVVQSEIDTSPDPERECGYFSGSPDVELQVLENAAHCQNFASTRLKHWRDVNAWIDRTS